MMGMERSNRMKVKMHRTSDEILGRGWVYTSTGPDFQRPIRPNALLIANYPLVSGAQAYCNGVCGSDTSEARMPASSAAKCELQENVEAAKSRRCVEVCFFRQRYHKDDPMKVQ
jgi:hypothetical protein